MQQAVEPHEADVRMPVPISRQMLRAVGAPMRAAAIWQCIARRREIRLPGREMAFQPAVTAHGQALCRQAAEHALHVVLHGELQCRCHGRHAEIDLRLSATIGEKQVFALAEGGLQGMVQQQVMLLLHEAQAGGRAPQGETAVTHLHAGCMPAGREAVDRCADVVIAQRTELQQRIVEHEGIQLIDQDIVIGEETLIEPHGEHEQTVAEKTAEVHGGETLDAEALHQLAVVEVQPLGRKEYLRVISQHPLQLLQRDLLLLR